MNATHIHLLITHLPIFGTMLGVLVLIFGFIVKSDHVKMAAYGIFVISAVGAAMAYFTGESTEETAEHVFNASRNAIHEHEEAAQFAFWSMMILGVLSLVTTYFTLKKHTAARKLSMAVLAFGLFSFSVVARTGYLGGQIRHTEIYEVPASTEHDKEQEH
jgi:uncharacterized membrane protein